jgi:hypothetical protein
MRPSAEKEDGDDSKTGNISVKPGLKHIRVSFIEKHHYLVK